MFPFADSTEPEAINSGTGPVFAHVAAYDNGEYAWPAGSLARFPRHILIGVETGQPRQAIRCRALDMERFDAGADDFPPFVRQRLEEGHRDPLGYTSILGEDDNEGLAAVLTALSVLPPDTPWEIWLAWYWGRNFPPAKAEVLAEIHALTGISLPPARLAACQWLPGPIGGYDTSVWYGRDTFTRRPAAADPLHSRSATGG